jgi:hypothetical protein
MPSISVIICQFSLMKHGESGQGGVADLLVFLWKLIPALGHLEVDGIGFHLLTRIQIVFEVLPHNGPGLLRIQESSSQRSLGRVRIAFLLLSPFALLLARLWSSDGSGDGIASGLGGFNGSSGVSCEVRGQLEVLDDLSSASEDRGRVLHVGAQQLGEAILHVSQAGLEVGEGHDDLCRGVNMGFEPCMELPQGFLGRGRMRPEGGDAARRGKGFTALMFESRNRCD